MFDVLNALPPPFAPNALQGILNQIILSVWIIASLMMEVDH